MDGRFPLPTLLSHALVAFTIEFDNEAEHQLPHKTTRHGATSDSSHSPWLVSMVMWFNCMQFVDEKGITVAELFRRAHTRTNLRGMHRWGYITVKPDPNEIRPKPPRSAWLIQPKRSGLRAQEIWGPLFATIEERWGERFGREVIQKLREALGAIVDQLHGPLPDCLPILGYGLTTAAPEKKPVKAVAKNAKASDLTLPSLLSKVLLAFALEFERESGVSLAIGANVLQLVDEEGMRVRDLPRLSGVSKEGIAMALSFLVKRGYATLTSESSDRSAKLIRLTSKGEKARKQYFDLLATIEDRWSERFGKQIIDALRRSLDPLVGDGTTQASPLSRGLEPYPENWRASVRRPEVLPHFPMVLHRGGYPDGS